MDDVTGTEKNDTADALDNIEELESADKLSQAKKKEKTMNAMKHFDFFYLIISRQRIQRIKLLIMKKYQ